MWDFGNYHPTAVGRDHAGLGPAPGHRRDAAGGPQNRRFRDSNSEEFDPANADRAIQGHVGLLKLIGSVFWWAGIGLGRQRSHRPRLETVIIASIMPPPHDCR